MIDLVTLEGIPIISTGIEYPASTGPFTCTQEDLEAVVESQDDPHVLPPRIKLGHEDNPLDAELQELFAERSSWEPSVGTVQNLRLSEDKQTLLGDFVGLPQWLAEVLASAYPARSIEGGPWTNEANGKAYRLTIEAVALLGVVWPGCTSLDDLATLYSEEGPTITVIEASGKGGKTVANIAAQVNVDDVRRVFYDEVAQGDQYWWWIRSMLLDPNEVIVDDEDGKLYRIPYNISGDAINFADPVPVKIEYVDLSAKGDKENRVAMAMIPTGKIIASYASRSESRPDNDDPEEVTMSGIDLTALRVSLGLAEDASEDQINAALAEAQPPAEPEPEPGNGGNPDDPEPEPAPEPEPEPSGKTDIPDGMSLVDNETLEGLKQGAQQGSEVYAERQTEKRNNDINAAIKAGKFPPARREHYELMYKNDPEGTRELFAKMAAGVIPVEERGVEDDPASQDVSEYPLEWLQPHERKAALAAREGAEHDAVIASDNLRSPTVVRS